MVLESERHIHREYNIHNTCWSGHPVNYKVNRTLFLSPLKSKEVKEFRAALTTPQCDRPTNIHALLCT